MKLEIELSEEARRRWALGLCAGGWAAGFGLVLYGIIADTPPRWIGLVAIFVLFIAGAATSASGRRLIAETIAGTVNAAFSAGLTTAQNARSATCVLECSREGYIIAARNSEAIGWNAEPLVDREMASLLYGNRDAEEVKDLIKQMFADDASPSVATQEISGKRAINTGNGGSLAVELTITRIADQVVVTMKRP